MCGIVGYVGKKRVVPIILDGLRRLEYRGYDSAGIAVAGNGDGLQICRAEGKLRNLEEAIRLKPIDGTYGIGHTRWATHGRPTEENAHPHRDCTGKIVVVHNGIIENYLDLKHELQQQGPRFVTETDTEIVAHLVEREVKDDGLENAVRRALLLMRGLFALVLISADDPEKIVAVRNGPPIVVGLRRCHGLLRASGLENDATGAVGPDHGGKGRLQALHAEGDLRAADLRAGNDPRPSLPGPRQGVCGG